MMKRYFTLGLVALSLLACSSESSDNGASGGATAGVGGAGNTMPGGGTAGVGGAGNTMPGGGTNSGTTNGAGSTSTSGGATNGTTTIGACLRTVGACAAPTVKVTEVALPATVTGYGDEGDTAPFPMAIAAMPSGGSRLAWLGTDYAVHVAQLDCDDNLVAGSHFSFPAVDFEDIIADDNGGVLLLTRNATNGGTDNCGSGTLCGGTSSQCRAMWMVRFDNAGAVSWETQVTNLSDSLAGYDDGALFVWWYQHQGRLATDGTNYAAYFSCAITVQNGSCVDIHEGDRMQVVGPTGTLLQHDDAFAWGLSHSWTNRIVYDARTSHFVMTGATDNDCRIAQPSYTTVAAGACDGTLFNGDLVLSTNAGYWNAWSQGGAIRLEHFTTGASDSTISNAGSSNHPHLVSYGSNNMLLAWESGAQVAAQVRSAADGSTVGSEFTIAVSDHNYQAFKSYSDGSVAYPAAGSNGSSIKIARVLPCSN